MSVRLPDIVRTYGCRETAATEIYALETDFAIATFQFGGMFCWFRKDIGRWTLFGKVTTKAKIVEAALKLGQPAQHRDCPP